MQKRRDHREEGFTLVELLMVMAVISVLIAMTLPSLVGTRKGANETNAIAQLRTVIESEENFKARNLGGGSLYGTLVQLESKGLMKWPTPGTYVKDGYTFTNVVAPTATSYSVYANANNSTMGDRDFAILNDGLLRTQAENLSTPTTVAGIQALGYLQ